MKKVILLLFVGATLFSCKKEQGCTDPSSISYSETAEEDDGTCQYDGRVVVWWNSVTATNLVNASIPSIGVSVGGVQEGSSSVNNFSVSEPMCSGQDGFTATVSLGTSTTKTLPYVIYDANNTSNIIQSGNVTVKGSSCEWVELTY